MESVRLELQQLAQIEHVLMMLQKLSLQTLNVTIISKDAKQKELDAFPADHHAHNTQDQHQIVTPS